MARRDEIIAYLDELLDAPGWPDYGPNGLQVPGAGEVTRVVTGVSACLALFEAARERGAELVLAHHGIFWGENGPLTAQQAAQLKVLLGSDINLAAYHLPLDAHAEAGNNALLIRALGLKRGAAFGEHKGRAIGWLAEAPGGIAAGELRDRLRAELDREPLLFDYGPERIERVAVITGSAPNYLQAAADAGADAFITGEPAERVMHAAREAGIHFFAAGHYATETFGVARLGDMLAERFGVQHEFIDLPNPV